MEIPIYSKSEIDYAISEGDHSLAEFEEYLNELILDTCLDDPALGIAKQAIDKGTRGLSDKQIFALKKGVEPYKMEHCSMCNAVMVVGKDDEGPFFCDSCLDRIKQSD